MKRILLFVAALEAVVIAVLVVHLGLLPHLLHGHDAARSIPMNHARSEFTFTVHAPLATAFPLFGPEGERPWAGPHWDPQFVYPTPAADIEGAVFRIRRGNHEATWVNTAFDARAGYAAYVYVIPEKLATRIAVQLTPIDAATTSVRVIYERTALDPSVYRDVGEMAQTDPAQGPEWEKSIADYLRKR
jgi:hypothetical protein